MEQPLVSAVTHDMNTAIIKMHPIPKGTKFIAELFNKLAEQNISVDVISQSYNTEGQRLAFSVPEEDLEESRDIVHQMISPQQVHLIKNLAKLSVVGVGMAHHSGVAGRFFLKL